DHCPVGLGEQKPRRIFSRVVLAAFIRAFENRGEVENQHYAPVAQYGSAADQIGFDSAIIECLDDQLFFTFEGIHDQAQLAFAKGDDQHKNLACHVVVIGATA